jgi:hypothetical protein
LNANEEANRNGLQQNKLGGGHPNGQTAMYSRHFFTSDQKQQVTKATDLCKLYIKALGQFIHRPIHSHIFKMARNSAQIDQPDQFMVMRKFRVNKFCASKSFWVNDRLATILTHDGQLAMGSTRDHCNTEDNNEVTIEEAANLSLDTDVIVKVITLSSCFHSPSMVGSSRPLAGTLDR